MLYGKNECCSAEQSAGTWQGPCPRPQASASLLSQQARGWLRTQPDSSPSSCWYLLVFTRLLCAPAWLCTSGEMGSCGSAFSLLLASHRAEFALSDQLASRKLEMTSLGEATVQEEALPSPASITKTAGTRHQSSVLIPMLNFHCPCSGTWSQRVKEVA